MMLEKENPAKKKEKDAEPAVKPLTPDEKRIQLLEGIKKTIIPSFIGAGFAILLYWRLNDASEVSWFSIILIVVLISYYIQKGLYPFLGIRVKEFGTKDWFYVEFLIIIFMLIVWTLLLN